MNRLSTRRSKSRFPAALQAHLPRVPFGEVVAAEVADPVAGLMGDRYSEGRLSNWVFDPEHRKRQETVVGVVSDIAHDIERHIAAGQNIVFFGPPGTGKDRLLASLIRAALHARKSVRFVSGANLWASTRDLIDRAVSEQSFLREFTAPDVLCISDPIPPGTSLSEFQASWLYRIVDGRYRDLKPVWVTANVADRKEGEMRMTPQVWDRLRDGAITIHCNWPSFRRPEKQI
jgi:DNA replication protein DnaC